MGQRASGARLARMQASPRWHDGRFRNLHPILPGLRDPTVPMPRLRDLLCGGEGRVPPGPLPALDPVPRWVRPPDSALRVTWLGHSTLLLEMDGLRVLTDPVWGVRASPTRLAGPKRFQPVPVPLRALPPLDLVLISHDHYDHLDYPTVRALRTLAVPFVTSLGVGAHLEGWGVPPANIIELDWWEPYTLPAADLTVTAVPSQHFSGRTLKSRNATLWSSWVLQSARQRVFFSGDTGLTTEYRDIDARLGPFDLAMLEVGGFHPAWGDMHLGPENALKALALLGNPPFLPIHWGTFALAMHAWDQPAEVLLELAPRAGAPLMMPRLGEPIEPAHAPKPQAWWRVPGSTGRVGGRKPSAGALPRSMPWPID